LISATIRFRNVLYERTVDGYVKNLRAKLADDPKAPRYVLTVPGVGYKFGMRTDG
jgi:DNA-binding response OmpR family regulator